MKLIENSFSTAVQSYVKIPPDSQPVANGMHDHPQFLPRTAVVGVCVGDHVSYGIEPFGIEIRKSPGEMNAVFARERRAVPS